MFIFGAEAKDVPELRKAVREQRLKPDPRFKEVLAMLQLGAFGTRVLACCPATCRLTFLFRPRRDMGADPEQPLERQRLLPPRARLPLVPRGAGTRGRDLQEPAALDPHVHHEHVRIPLTVDVAVAVSVSLVAVVHM